MLIFFPTDLLIILLYCSDDELLSTKSASSPLSLITSGFGIEDSGSLHELNITDGVLKLSGYVSGPCDTFPIKV